jgi:hypothetical protein
VSAKTWKKLSDFFSERAIFLLVNPREKLSPGWVYQTEDDDIHAHQFTKLRTLLTSKTKEKEYTLPQSETDSPQDQLEGVLENKTNLNLALDFAQNLFNKLKSGLGLQVRANYSSRKMGTFQISSISTEGLDVGELMDSVTNYKVKENFMLNNSPKNYYIVTKTWYSESVRLLLGNLSKQEIDFYSNSFGVNIGGRFEKTVNNAWSIVCDKKVAFGISLARLDFDRISEEILMNIVPHDTLKIPLAEKDSVLIQDLSKMPPEKTTMS